MYRRSKKGKYFFALVIACILMFPLSSSSHLVYAEDEEELKLSTPEDPMYQATNGIYKDEDVDYSLDLVSPKQIEDKGFFGKVKDIVTFEFVSDGFSEAFNYSLFSILKFYFEFNKFMTNIMIGTLNFAYDTNLVDTIIDSISSTITSMTGISGFSFTESGLFGGFLGIIGAVVAFYTLYQFVVKRASISAFGGLLKSIVVLTVALAFFSNYTTIIKGLNTLSVEASGLILSGSANTIVSDGNITNKTVKEQMNDNLFNMFVHKPYLMLQYSTTNQSQIGDDRVLKLLKAKAGTEDRANIAVSEVTDHGNGTLTYSYLLKRLNFMAIILIANAINSIPVYLLSLSLIVFQFWFIVMAMIAPFVLLWSALPNQIGVLKRYFFELSIPLILKSGVSLLAILIFGLSEIMYGLSTLSNGTLGIILGSMVQGLLLLTMFLLRKRIFSVFSLGSTQLGAIREEMSNQFVKPIKKGVKTATTAVGAIGGAAVGGPQGAMIGASVGNSIGNTVTGEADVGDTARNVGMSMYMADRVKTNNNNPEMDSRESRIESNGEKAMELANNDTSYNRLRSYLHSKELPTDTVNETLLAVDKLNLDDIEFDEMQKQYNNMANLVEEGKGNKIFADTFAKGIKINREQEAIKKGTTLEGTPIESSPINNEPINKGKNTNESNFTNNQSQSLNEMENESSSEYNFKKYSLEEVHASNTIEEPKQEEVYLENNN